EACDEGKVHRHAAVGAALEEEHRLALTGHRCNMLFFVAERSLAAFADHVGGLREAEHVENQRDAAIAHDRRAREGFYAFELLAERLDDDFFGVVDFVDNETELTLVCLEHDDVDGGKFGEVGRFIFDFEFAIEIDERKKAAAEAVHGNTLDELDALLRVFAV